jgi:ribA/ribD-fused uncharacterized protein
MKNQIDSFQGEYRFLSNFWPVNIYYDGLMYPTVEHAYQAQKTVLKGIRQKIANLEKPGDAKRLGEELELLRKVRLEWNDEFKISIMNSLLKQKFSTGNHELLQKLLATGDAELIEGNTWGDTFWGVCEGKGENLLGKILMEIRSDVQNCGI